MVRLATQIVILVAAVCHGLIQAQEPSSSAVKTPERPATAEVAAPTPNPTPPKKARKRKAERKKAEAKRSEVANSDGKPATESKPEAKEPEAKQSEAKQPEAKQPEAKQPEAKQPEAKEPDAKKPDAKKPDAKKPDAKKPDAKKPDAKKPQAKKPEAKTPEAKQPEGKKPEAKTPEAKTPEAKKPEAKKPDAKKPEAKKPEAKTPEAKQPEAKKPEAKLTDDQKLEAPKLESKKPESVKHEGKKLPGSSEGMGKPDSGQPPTSPADLARQAATDATQVDSDFAWQGEFMGRASGWWRGADFVGLQVVALGAGKFDAVLYRGGLPGGGWDEQERVKLSGELSKGGLRLTGDQIVIEVHPETAVVRGATGPGEIHLERWHRISATQDAPPPPGAIVLFDGSSVSQFTGGQVTPEGYLDVGALTKMSVADFQLHLEFRTPYMPYARGQGRGNSGVYIQQRYEVQILDSFGLDGVENECGGLYKQRRPLVNMCLPPLSWQTYDIYFSAARWDERGQKTAPARVTVLHNGVPIHLNYELTAKTGGGKVEGPEPFPILLQNHSNPVRFRNVWIVPGGSLGTPN